MPRVDFYIVAEHNLPYRFVCHLANKVRGEGYDIYIHATSRDEALTIDDMLWTFQDISFLPHSLVDSMEARDCPIIIGWQGQDRLPRQVLMNLSATPPEPMDGYERIIEVVPSDPDFRRPARQRYKDYRDKGLELYSHNIEPAHA